MAVIYTFQMANIFSSKALQNWPEWGFLVLKYVYHLATLASTLCNCAQMATFQHLTRAAVFCEQTLF
jgi:hypothetical protein